MIGGTRRGESAKASWVEVEGVPESLQSLARYWAELWGVPGLLDSVTVEYSTRFRTSLGLCTPVEGRIRLAAHLRDGDPDLLEEVLCHELAHVAAFRLHGIVNRPHGPEWEFLVAQAGYEPRIRLPREATEAVQPRQSHARYEHRCPVCHSRRIARRPVPGWRCVECRNTGLPGLLEITRLDDAESKSTEVSGTPEAISE